MKVIPVISKLPAFIILLTSNLCSYSQTVTKYYDDWEFTTKDKAVYYAVFVKQGNVYQCTSYWIAGNKLRAQSIYPDTLLENPIGLQKRYYKNGQIEDSIFYEGGKVKFLYRFYPNKQLALHYVPGIGKEAVVKGYDEEGKKIKNYVLEKEAEFKGGMNEWLKYLQKNASKDITVKTKGDVTVQVQIKFIIDEEGNVTNAKVFKSSGFKEADRDALRVVSESPEWRSAIQFNNPVKTLRIQPFTYTLIGK